MERGHRRMLPSLPPYWASGLVGGAAASLYLSFQRPPQPNLPAHGPCTGRKPASHRSFALPLPGRRPPFARFLQSHCCIRSARRRPPRWPAVRGALLLAARCAPRAFDRFNDHVLCLVPRPAFAQPGRGSRPRRRRRRRPASGQVRRGSLGAAAPRGAPSGEPSFPGAGAAPAVAAAARAAAGGAASQAGGRQPAAAAHDAQRFRVL